jgi:hypothetical protein
MKQHRLRTLVVLVGTLLASLVVAASAAAAPVTVNVRIEGSTSTIYEGPITTDAKVVTTQAGGSHECDGTQNGNSLGNSPGGTPTTALDDALAKVGVSWDGSFQFNDIFVERIGSDGQVGVFGSSFWGVSVNRVSTPVGGCQFRVNNGDTVLWDWTQFQAPNLELSGPSSVQVGVPATLTVQQYDDNGNLSPAVGASVAGTTTDANGNASVIFANAGTQHLKATLSGANRSNAIDLCVYNSSAAECAPPSGGGSTAPVHDSVAPDVTIGNIKKGQKFAHGKGPRRLSGKASDAGGLFQVYFRLTRVSGGECQWYSSKRSVFTKLQRRCKARYQRVGSNPTWTYLLPKRLGPGRYTLDEKAIDKAFNRSLATVTFTVRR